jgi:centromeric protein E
VPFPSADELVIEDTSRSGDSISVTIRFRPLRWGISEGVARICLHEAVSRVEGALEVVLSWIWCACSEREFQRGDEISWYPDGDRLVRCEYNPATAYAYGE